MVKIMIPSNALMIMLFYKNLTEMLVKLKQLLLVKEYRLKKVQKKLMNIVHLILMK